MRYLIIILIITISSGIFADELKAKKQTHTFKKYNIGFNGGFVSGSGLFYKRWFNSGNGFRISLMPIINSDHYDGNTSTFISTGINGLYSLNETKYTNIFIYYGGSLYYDNNYTFEKYGELTTYLGGGAGIELHFYNLTFEISTGLAPWFKYGENNNYNYYYDEKEENTNPKGKFGIHPDISGNITFSFGEF